jgi:hypothetical protein
LGSLLQALNQIQIGFWPVLDVMLLPELKRAKTRFTKLS